MRQGRRHGDLAGSNARRRLVGDGRTVAWVNGSSWNEFEGTMPAALMAMD